MEHTAWARVAPSVKVLWIQVWLKGWRRREGSRQDRGMPEFSILAAYVAAVAVITVVPGPGQAVMIAKSVGAGRSAALATALGLETGTMVHCLLAAFGLSAVLAQVPVAFVVVKVIGAAYLIGIGLRSLVGRTAPHGRGDASPDAGWATNYRQAVMIGVLNPKVALFFMAFLPQFVQPARGLVILQFLVLGVVFCTIGLCFNVIITFAGDLLGRRIRDSRRWQLWTRRASGTVMVLLGIRLAAQRV
ncbi:LysE family translocator [Kribbella pittospori]|uniref:LysE family translocator n=2 Tax=Kribbella pittospori TaxID=722689 RepID=A0A4R0KDB9_9ACTN|nr:LysE family translocator [Kribbella pittospori]